MVVLAFSTMISTLVFMFLIIDTRDKLQALQERIKDLEIRINDLR